MTDKKKRIIQHYLYSGLGGHGAVFFSLVEADKEEKYLYKAFFCGIEELRESYKDNCIRLQIPYTYLKKKKGLHLGAYFKVFRGFLSGKPNVIFLHGAGFSIVSAFWYKITRPRTKIMVRDTQAHHLKSRAEWFWLFFCLLFAKRIVVLTEAAAKGIKGKFGWFAPSRKLVIIPNGLNMDKYKPAPVRNSEDKLNIGMQSRLQPIKDHPTLIRAFKKLKEEFPGKALSLHIAGDGETMPATKKLVEELGLSEDVQLHGMLNEEQLLSFMASLDIYVHATYGETLSNSIMQAMASKLPIIASDVWGVNNMITDQQNGLLYRSEDVDQLTVLLKSLVMDPDQRSRLGSRARQFAEDHYSNKIMFERYSELYA